MIGNIPGVKHESTVGAALLGCTYCDFAILHYLVPPIYLTDHAHCLSRIGFLHHLPMKKHPRTSLVKALQHELGLMAEQASHSLSKNLNMNTKYMVMFYNFNNMHISS